MNTDTEMLNEFITGEQNRVAAIKFLKTLPALLDEVSDIADDIYKQRTAFMSLLIKLLCDTGMYTVTFNVSELAYYENYSVKVFSEDEDEITLQVIFPSTEAIE